jgi:hypothetical protein
MGHSFDINIDSVALRSPLILLKMHDKYSGQRGIWVQTQYLLQHRGGKNGKFCSSWPVAKPSSCTQICSQQSGFEVRKSCGIPCVCS